MHFRVESAVSTVDQAARVEVPLLGAFAPWQATYLIVAMPGIVAIALMLFVREPPRRELRISSARDHSAAHDLQFLRENIAAYASLLFGFAIIAIITYGNSIWLPATFFRTWGWSPALFGAVYASVILLFGAGGAVLSGFVADALASKGQRDASLRVASTGALLAIPANLLFLASGNAWIAMTGVALTTLFLSMPIALTANILISPTPNRLRGQVISMGVVLINLIGLGVGPVLVSSVTSQVLRSESRIQQSLGMVCLCAAALGWLLLRAARTRYVRLLQRATDEDSA